MQKGRMQCSLGEAYVMKGLLTWLVLKPERLCLSAQSVISLSVKTLLKHVGSVLFSLNSARSLSNKSFGMPSFSCWSWRCNMINVVGRRLNAAVPEKYSYVAGKYGVVRRYYRG